MDIQWTGLDRTSMAENMLTCSTVEEFAALLEERGIWLNDAAAQAAYGEVRRIKDGELNDDELVMVGGGSSFYEPYDMVKALEAAVFRWAE